jgi:hypothetical protein
VNEKPVFFACVLVIDVVVPEMETHHRDRVHCVGDRHLRIRLLDSFWIPAL